MPEIRRCVANSGIACSVLYFVLSHLCGGLPYLIVYLVPRYDIFRRSYSEFFIESRSRGSNMECKRGKIDITRALAHYCLSSPLLSVFPLPYLIDVGYSLPCIRHNASVPLKPPSILRYCGVASSCVHTYFTPPSVARLALHFVILYQ